MRRVRERKDRQGRSRKSRSRDGHRSTTAERKVSTSAKRRTPVLRAAGNGRTVRISILFTRDIPQSWEPSEGRHDGESQLNFKSPTPNNTLSGPLGVSHLIKARELRRPFERSRVPPPGSFDDGRGGEGGKGRGDTR